MNQKGGSIYELSDPEDVQQRITMTNYRPSMLFFIAQKTEQKPIFSIFSQKINYQNIRWNNKRFIKDGRSSLLSLPIKKIPESFQPFMVKFKIFFQSFKILRSSGISNSKHIRKVKNL